MEKKIEPEDFRNVKSMNAVNIYKFDSQLVEMNFEKMDIEELLEAGFR